MKRAKVAAAAAAARWSFMAQSVLRSSYVFQQSHEHSCSPGLYDAWAAAGCIRGAALCLTAGKRVSLHEHADDEWCTSGATTRRHTAPKICSWRPVKTLASASTPD